MKISARLQDRADSGSIHAAGRVAAKLLTAWLLDAAALNRPICSLACCLDHNATIAARAL